MTEKSLKIDVEDSEVSALWLAPPKPRAALVLAHGAGTNMTSSTLTALANGLATRSIASLRYNFLYSERGSSRPDSPPRAHAAVRAAVAEAAKLAPKLPLFAGGRSFGGRMTSQAQALEPLAHVRGLIFFAFPLHTAGKPSDERAKHLFDVKVPMLFLQGTKDALAEPELLKPLIKKLGARATLKILEAADHSFHVAAKSGRKDADVLAEILNTTADWIAAH
ncbi:MAG: alpha/beta family hydrolase [Alphaproteobacteria bacterium]